MPLSEPTNEHGHALKKELRLRDLVLMQILLVVGISWCGIPARQGPSHTWFWIGGIFAIFIPQAMVVQYCSRIWPLEGGVYQWTKFVFGPRRGVHQRMELRHMGAARGREPRHLLGVEPLLCLWPACSVDGR